jgi:Raf kinase inhibitor-like YbhB/YbcL family protein
MYLTMKIISSAFENEGLIPNRYTCDGENINPPLEFSEISPSAQSLALIMDDPDVPKDLRPDGMFDHWVVFNIKPSMTTIKENVDAKGTGVSPFQTGLNTKGTAAYTGPCPPDKEHRYFFKLYALDTTLNLNQPTKAELEQAMEGHILDQAVLMGRYDRLR